MMSYTNQQTTASAAAFPAKLHRLLQDADRLGFDDIISWQSPDGVSFKIYDPERFVHEIMPTYFKQCTKLKSFHRQLHMYAFKRIQIGPNMGGYWHKLFKKDDFDQCHAMVRKATSRPGRKLKRRSTKVAKTSTRATFEQKTSKPYEVLSSSSNAATTALFMAADAAAKEFANSEADIVSLQGRTYSQQDRDDDEESIGTLEGGFVETEQFRLLNDGRHGQNYDGIICLDDIFSDHQVQAPTRSVTTTVQPPSSFSSRRTFPDVPVPSFKNLTNTSSTYSLTGNTVHYVEDEKLVPNSLWNCAGPTVQQLPKEELLCEPLPVDASRSFKNPMAVAEAATTVQKVLGEAEKDDEFSNTEPTTFPHKLHKLLQDSKSQGFDHIISWIDDGKSFKVHNHKQFVNLVMPNYFEQTMYQSFRRQLNLYGFQRIARGAKRGVLSHPCFLRDSPSLCQLMVRQPNKGATPTTNTPVVYNSNTPTAMWVTSM